MAYSAQVIIGGKTHEAIGLTKASARQTLEKSLAAYARRTLPDCDGATIASTCMADAKVMEMNPAR